MGGIKEWLDSLGLGEYAPRFAENDVDFAILTDLTDQGQPRPWTASVIVVRINATTLWHSDAAEWARQFRAGVSCPALQDSPFRRSGHRDLVGPREPYQDHAGRGVLS